MDVIEYSKQIKQDAEALLKETQIIEIYSQFGEVIVVGSLPADLMWDPDIDLVVITDNAKEVALKAFNSIVRSEKFQKIEFGDFQNFPRVNRPKSYIINTRREWNEKNWEIETWFLSEADEKINLVKKLNNLSGDDRLKILHEKKKRSESNTSKHSLSSYEIYSKFTTL